jgi:glutathionylspermidine synthase
MQRIRTTERADWRDQATALGFNYNTIEGKPYWDETAYYQFSLAQIEGDLEATTQELVGMCYQAVEHIIGREPLLRRFAIPDFAWDYLRRSWGRQDKDLYGRFDLRYDGKGAPKLFEFNADTPTALFEAAVFQWQWLEQGLATGALPAGADQFNSIHERLIAAFGGLGLEGRTLHLAALSEHPEDRLTVEYLADCASQAGATTKLIAIADIGVTADHRFTDLDDQVITHLFKLYPWEWLLADPFGAELPRDQAAIIEPIWKMTLSNKGLLAVLWELFPDHPALLPAYFEDDPRAETLGDYVRKPLLGREGSNIELVRRGVAAQRTASDGEPYGSEGYVRQALAALPEFSGNYPVIGSWVVAGRACGIGIREEDQLITSNTARFVPHVILN